jgi:hypothetical protein
MSDLKADIERIRSAIDESMKFALEAPDDEESVKWKVDLTLDAAAWNRIEAALADREHLEEAAKLLTYIFDCAEADVEPGELDIMRSKAWLEAERARQEKSR